jgi:hypothetical protein
MLPTASGSLLPPLSPAVRPARRSVALIPRRPHAPISVARHSAGPSGLSNYWRIQSGGKRGDALRDRPERGLRQRVAVRLDRLLKQLLERGVSGMGRLQPVMLRRLKVPKRRRVEHLKAKDCLRK